MGELASVMVIIVGALLLSGFGGYPLMRFALDRLSRPSSQDSPEEQAPQRALRGGAWIGILERLATTGAILAGQPGLIAIVVAVKGLGRFDELKGNPAASEKFVVGTLFSLLWASGVGALGVVLLTYVSQPVI